mmetsp:Transcript_15767/g.34276  ORF Transcript_15767/g.34276 Transcript_15767/m.34276 type:complete len:168 (+) Transcript_15767:182-685(+)|eukprot:CAMPEP_0178504298 /NCGR_PEP_ID=MMETSP0696-20121128/18514_1 /TAXON_ID=265572 /ORGANISM="Extubocellulus spinifer, Strain CCMP396" /LENGTH=167 /DNA_ID=CAMNT_0020133515 /DNA_START=163 /DNA_END=666 /DNA_ORIENTATION=-
MTYRSRGRSMIEVAVAVTFVGFLTGFVVVLCVGNYFRAKRAQERQRQRRLANHFGSEQDGGGGGALPDSPRSQYSATSSAYTDEGPEHQHPLHQRKIGQSASKGVGGGGGIHSSLYRTQKLNPQYRQTSFGQHSKHSTQYTDDEADLLMIPEEDFDRRGPSSDVMSV